MGNSKNKDTEGEEENDSTTSRITRHWRATAVGDGSADMLRSNDFSYYKSINQGNKAMRQR
eukprot:4176504-Ditylum_brightwellii.AAC.1